MEKLKEFICRDPIKVRHRVFLFGLVIGLLLYIAGLYAKFFLPFGIGLLLLSCVYAWFAFRCPHCNAYLGERITLYNHCPKCGKEIEQ